MCRCPHLRDNQIFRRMKSRIVMVMLALMLAAFYPAPERMITGVITDVSTGGPLPGAAVNHRGTSNGNMGENAGMCGSAVPEKGGKLVLSCVGYDTREVAIGITGRIDVSLIAKVMRLAEV